MIIKNSINDLVFFILAFLYVTAILISDNPIVYILFMVCALLNILILKKINYKYISIFTLSMLPGLLIMFGVAVFFSNAPSTGKYIEYIIGTHHFKVYYPNLYSAINVVLRTFTITICSFVFVLHIDAENLTICAMKQFKLPVKIGYAILAMNNAFRFIGSEFSRIRMAYKMRFRKNLGIYKTLYPLLISASRYSSICGMSLETRGLNDSKTFIVKCKKWQLADTIVLLINVGIIALTFLY